MTASCAGPRSFSLTLAWFGLVNLAVCLFVFRDAMWGNKILAPLDVLPACFTNFRFIDPDSTGIPAANTQFDQVVYDLPLQYGIYQSYRRGEVPWWDPYGFSGRPFLADAHINGTDPVRLLAYAGLPFELAYNWTLIGHFFCSGLAMFLLLRWWRFPIWICGFLALTFEFAGCQTWFFGFPWIQGALWCYPLLWLCWDAAFETGRGLYYALASFAVAGIFYAGNLQSHAYVLVFAAAFALGYAALSVGAWRRVLPILLLTGLCGACLAAPVLFNQLEFFAAGLRGVRPALSLRVCLTGLGCLTSIYPWMLGDPWTLDLRNVLFNAVGLGQNYGLGFHTFIGSAGLVMALWAAATGHGSQSQERIRRAAVWLGVLFLVVVSSPLVTILYTRMAGLFVLAAVVLMALGLKALTESAARLKTAGWCLAVMAILVGAATNVGALVLYPRLLPKVRQALQARESEAARGAIFKMPPAYREFQIKNLPKEISFANPAAFVAFLSLLCLAGLLMVPAWRQNPAIIGLLLALNLAPAVLFCARFVPRQPLSYWQRLLAGGPAQQAAINAVGPEHLRLLESAALRNDFVFPDALEHLYRVHTVHGYSALVPPTLQSLGLATNQEYRAYTADYLVRNGELQRLSTNGITRFRWLDARQRAIQVQESSLTEIRLLLSPGGTGTLLWTDTFYPGWRATIDGRPVTLRREPPCFTRIEIPADSQTVILSYRPRFLTRGLVACGVGLAGVGLMMASARSRDPERAVRKENVTAEL
jgi:hypothetical protein